MECLAETGANGPLLFGIIALALLAIVGAVLLIVRNRQHRNGALLALGLIVGLGLLPLASAPNAHAGVDCNGQEAAPAVTVTTTETAPAVTQTEPGTTVTQTGPTVTEPGVTSTETQTGPTVTETGPAVTTTATVTGPTVTEPVERTCPSAGTDISSDFLAFDQTGTHDDTEITIPAALSARVQNLVEGKNAAGDTLCDAHPIQWVWKQNVDELNAGGTVFERSSSLITGGTTGSATRDDGQLTVLVAAPPNPDAISGGVINGYGPERPAPVVVTGKFFYTGPDGVPTTLRIVLTDDTAMVGLPDWDSNPGDGQG